MYVENIENILYNDYSPVPIKNFEYNILKSKLLYMTSQEVGNILPRIISRISKYGQKESVFDHEFEIEKGLIVHIKSYHIYAEQALISAVSASDVYFKDKLSYEITKDKIVLKKFSEKQIDVKRILDIGLNLSYDIGKLITEKEDFQSVEYIQKEYKKAFDFDPFDDTELKELRKIFAIRHLIIHRAGIVDHKFIRDTGLDYKIGESFIISLDEILDMINFMEKTIIELDQKIDNRYKKRKSMLNSKVL